MSRRLAYRRWPYLAITLGFLLSRWAWAHAGVRFDASPLRRAWQVLDVPLLTDDLARSLYNLHMQPPLFNLYLGTVLKLSDGDAWHWFRWGYLATGLVLALGIGALAMRLGAKPWAATVAALLFSLAPSAILYENWLFYTYPTAMLLVLAAIATHRFARTGRLLAGTVAFTLMASALYIRGVFHIVWLGAAVALLVWLLEDRRRAVVLAALPALVLSGALYLKNLVEFGVPGTSSWVGMNLTKLTTWTLPETDREEALAEGAVSELALVLPFQPLGSYPARFRVVEPPAVPALSQTRKSTRRPNLNHLAYVSISKQYLADSLALIRRHPGNYLRSVGRAWLIFLRSPSEYRFLQGNRQHLIGWDRVYSAAVYGAFPASYPDRLPRLRNPLDTRQSLQRVGWIWAVLLAACVVFAVRAAFGARRHDPARAATLLFVALTIVWVATVGNLAEIGENNRFRMLIEPLVFVLAAAGASRTSASGASTG